MVLQQCWPRWGDTLLRDSAPRPGAQLSPTISGATGLTRTEAHRIGSEPFQFTDAPFHLRAGGQQKRV